MTFDRALLEGKSSESLLQMVAQSFMAASLDLRDANGTSGAGTIGGLGWIGTY